jgi:hypothetical protein
MILPDGCPRPAIHFKNTTEVIYYVLANPSTRSALKPPHWFRVEAPSRWCRRQPHTRPQAPGSSCLAVQLGNYPLLTSIKTLGTAKPLALTLSPLDPRVGAATDQAALELGNVAHNRQHSPANVGGRAVAHECFGGPVPVHQCMIVWAGRTSAVAPRPCRPSTPRTP